MAHSPYPAGLLLALSLKTTKLRRRMRKCKPALDADALLNPVLIKKQEKATQKENLRIC